MIVYKSSKKMKVFIFLQQLGIKLTRKFLVAETTRSNMPAVTYSHCRVTKHKIPEEQNSNIRTPWLKSEFSHVIYNI
jgi:hypothetical protein